MLNSERLALLKGLRGVEGFLVLQEELKEHLRHLEAAMATIETKDKGADIIAIELAKLQGEALGLKTALYLMMRTTVDS